MRWVESERDGWRSQRVGGGGAVYRENQNLRVKKGGNMLSSANK